MMLCRLLHGTVDLSSSVSAYSTTVFNFSFVCSCYKLCRRAWSSESSVTVWRGYMGSPLLKFECLQHNSIMTKQSTREDYRIQSTVHSIPSTFSETIDN